MKIFLVLCTAVLSEGLMQRPESRDGTFSVDGDSTNVLAEAFVKHLATSSPTKDIKFFLFTRNQPQGAQLQISSRKTLLNSGFDFNAETKILIHGFANSLSSDFNQLLKNAYLESGDYNVVVVDWSALFNKSTVDNTGQVAVVTARLVAWLIAQGVSWSHLHLLGQNIGAHIAGSVGHHLRNLGRLGRITGLDPAKPIFGLNEYLLSSRDAQFVDCVHTCGGFLGQSDPTCSVDFYPNGGNNPQPGCTYDFFGVCSHQRAYQYFAESVTDASAFQSVKCSTVESYSGANCSSSSRATMGEHVDHRTRGVYYLATASEPMYSLRAITDITNTASTTAHAVARGTTTATAKATATGTNTASATAKSFGTTTSTATATATASYQAFSRDRAVVQSRPTPSSLRPKNELHSRVLAHKIYSCCSNN